MQAEENLRAILRAQDEQSGQIRAVIAELAAADFINENRTLKERAEQLGTSCRALDEKARTLAEENRSLKEKLLEQMYSQRGAIISGAKHQSMLYFANEQQNAVNELSRLNSEARGRIGAMREELRQKAGPRADEIYGKLAEAETLLRAHVYEYSKAVNTGFEAERAQAGAQYDRMAAAPITEEQINRKLKDNNVELRLGGRVTSIIGVVFLLLFLVLGIRYSYEYIDSPGIKTALMFGASLLVLAFGEFLYRRRGKNFFSVSICALAVSFFFASTAISYFEIGFFNIPAALGVCVVVTALALFLSHRYNSQVIAVFGLVGGYLPMTALGADRAMILSAMGYFLLLNLFVLLVAARKQWQVIRFFSVILGFQALAFLTAQLEYKPLFAINIYIVANLLMYMAIILAYPILQKQSLRVSDTVLLGITTVFGASMLYTTLFAATATQYNGMVAIVFCAIYFAIAVFLRFFLTKDSGARGLFYATSFAFLVLAVPLLFDSSFITLGWLIEGVALCVFGIITGRKWYMRAGAVISLLCAGSFLLVDMLWGSYSSRASALFVWKYSLITLGSLLILSMLIYKHYGSRFWTLPAAAVARVYQAAVLVNLWGYLIYIAGRLTSYDMVPIWWFWRPFAYAVVTLGLAAAYGGLGLLHRPLTKVMSGVMYVLGLIGVLWLNGEGIGYTLTVEETWLPLILANIALIALCIAAVLALLQLWRLLSASPTEWRPLSVCAFSLVLVLQLLVVQANIGVNSMIVSVLLIVWSLGMVVFGFIRRYSYMRRFGLALTLLAIAKLAFFDLYDLTPGQRVVSFLLFGLVCFGISYVYFFFSRKYLAAAPSVRPEIAEEEQSEQQ